MAVRVAVVNLGCKVNRVESDWMETAFVEAGCMLVSEGQADVVAINTCAVTGEAQAKTRKAVRRAANLPQRPFVAVTGCVANLFPDELEALASNVSVFPNKATLAPQVLEAFTCENSVACGPASAVPDAVVYDWQAPSVTHAGATAPSPAVGEAAVADDNENAEPLLGAPHGTFRSRRGVKVQDGCDNRCSYCIVWRARGASRSVSVPQIESQVRQVLAEGADEVVLSGINLGRFRGVDEHGADLDLGGLLDRVCALGARSVRVSSVEPPDLTQSVVDAMARHPQAVCAHLHLPLQAGSDTVLERMGRHYTTAEFLQVVGRVKRALPHVSLSTDVIVGFPGETEAEFEETLAFCRTVAFSKIHVFRYSARPDTAAASMPGQIDPRVAQQRSERLRTLAHELRAADAAARVGTVEQVLVEYVDPDGTARGTTASYHDVLLPPGSHPLTAPGLLQVRFTAVEGTLLNAVVC